jgi:RNA polymerase sigma-70 factor (ECF subfamily)
VDQRPKQGEPQIGLPDETRWAAEGGATVDARIAEAYASVNGDVVRYLGAVVGRGVAEDVASQVWVEVVARAGAFRGDQAAFRRWVLATARRRALDHRRRWWQRSVVLRPPGAFELDRPVVDELGSDAVAAVARIKRLPAVQAEVVLLRVLGGYSAEEVADMTGRTPGAVRVIQHRALRRLAKELEREAPREGGV